MRDYDRALSDIADIRSRMAASTTFHGLGPAALAATAASALITAAAQDLVLERWEGASLTFFVGWIVTAVFCCAVVGAEMIGRSRRHHGGLADTMIHNAVRQFLPAGVAGAAFVAIIMQFTPENAWIVPGVWQLLVSLGLFAAVPSLPRGTVLAAAWYFLTGCTVLMTAAADHALSPWLMGGPFIVGQLLLAGVVAFAPGEADDD